MINLKSSKIIAIMLLGTLLMAQIPLAVASSNCTNRVIIEKQCSGPSFCDSLDSDGAQEGGTPDSFCGNYGRVEGSCIAGQGTKDNHYHDGWYLMGREWHTSVCEAEGHPCGQGDCYQTMWDVLLNGVFAPGCWDPENEGDYYDEVNTDCIVHVSTNCNCLQDDASRGVDAGDNIASATLLGSGGYSGKLIQTYDSEDWYEFNAPIGARIDVSMTPPTGVNFDLELYDPNGNFRDGSWIGAGYTDHISFMSDVDGYWHIRIWIRGGEGNYSLTLSVDTGGGGCPYVSAWSGTRYVLDNNILPTSKPGNESDVEDHYKLSQSLVPKDGRYSLIISEFEHEHSYIDHVELLAVDHDSDVNIALDPHREILTFKNPAAPASVLDNHGNNRLSEIRLMDGDVLNHSTFFYGNASDFLVLNFGRVREDNAKLILRDDMKSEEVCIDIQILDRAGQWQTVATVTPRSYWAVEGVDLSSYIPKNRDFQVRLLWTSSHRLDYAGLDTTRQADYQLTYGNLTAAIHSTQGDVKAQLTTSDNQYAEIVPGQQIQLDFTISDNQRQTRTFIVCSEGHYYTMP